MPSLHAGIAFLVAAYAIMRLRSWWRWLLVLYPVAMGVSLVYNAEHYVVDVLAGWLVAVLVLVGCAWWERVAAAGGRAAVSDEAGRTASRAGRAAPGRQARPPASPPSCASTSVVAALRVVDPRGDALLRVVSR